MALSCWMLCASETAWNGQHEEGKKATSSPFLDHASVSKPEMEPSSGRPPRLATKSRQLNASALWATASTCAPDTVGLWQAGCRGPESAGKRVWACLEVGGDAAQAHVVVHEEGSSRVQLVRSTVLVPAGSKLSRARRVMQIEWRENRCPLLNLKITIAKNGAVREGGSRGAVVQHPFQVVREGRDARQGLARLACTIRQPACMDAELEGRDLAMEQNSG